MPSPFVHDFAEETGVFGLHLFKTDRGTFYTVFWCTFVALFACYTTKTLVDVTAKFVNEDVVTFVEHRRDANFSFDFVQLCFFGQPLNTVAPMREDEALESLLQTFENETAHPLEKSAFIAVLRFFSRLRKNHNRVKIDAILRSSATHQSYAEEAASLRAFDAARRRQRSAANHTLASLFERVLVEFCRSLRLGVHLKDFAAGTEKLVLDACETGYPTPPASMVFYDAPFAFCIDLKHDAFVFRSGLDSFAIEFDTSSAAAALGIFVPRCFLTFDDLLSSKSIDDFDAAVYVVPASTQVQFVKIGARYNNLNLRRRPCSDDRTKTAWCADLCESHFFYGAFGCWPLFYTFQFSPLRQNLSRVERRCDADDYLKFDTNSSLVAPSGAVQKGIECQRGCTQPCSKLVFSVSSVDEPLLSAPPWTVQTVYLQSHVYPVFDERLANDFESFLSDFGGALGLWLGASFASLIHIPLYLLQAVIAGWCTRRKGGVKATGAGHHGVEKRTADVEIQTLSNVVEESAIKMAGQ